MSYETLAELIRDQTAQLEQRMGDQHTYLRHRIDEIMLAQQEICAVMLARLDAHEEYHRRNEHRWGLVKLAARYPFRFAALAVGVVIVGGGSLRVGVAQGLLAFFARLVGVGL